MSLNLDSVEAYIDDARTLLLDRLPPYRYSDTSLIVALNLSLLEGRRMRADLFLTRRGIHVPSYAAISSDEVPIEPQFRLAFVYGLCGHALLRDQDDVQDQRANLFKSTMEAILTGVKSPPMAGATPGPGSPTK